MKTKTQEFKSCYDELLSKLFLMTFEDNINYTEVANNDGETSISLISDEPQLIQRNTENNSCYYANNFTNNPCYYNNVFDLTAHEILIYSLLLHKCIVEQSEVSTISYKELQQLRNKRVGNSKVVDDATLNAYDKAFEGLCSKRIKYDIGNSRQNKNITYRQYEQPLLMVWDLKELSNGDMIFNYSLGPFGKTLIESKRYSNLVPAKYFTLNFKEVMSYEIALYVCRMIYINKKKKKPIIITLNSIMKNISKFMNTEKYGLVKYCDALYYSGPNVRRLWNSVIMKVIELLDTLKDELKIKDYVGNYDVIENSPYLTNYQFKEVKWIIHLYN